MGMSSWSTIRCRSSAEKVRLRRHHVSAFTNEDATVFKVAGCRADTAIMPRAMALAETECWRGRGFVVDTSVCCPTAASFVQHSVRNNSAVVDGCAAAMVEARKHATYDDVVYDGWRVVPLVHESYGRMGQEARRFVRELAAHSAACNGGGALRIARRQAVLCRSIVCDLSVALAVEMAERLLAYMRGAAQAGRRLRPVSLLLSSFAA